MKRGHQREDGLIFFGFKRGEEVWMDVEMFDTILKAARRRATRLAARYHAALTERTRQKLREARADLRARMYPPITQRERDLRRKEVNRKHYYNKVKKPSVVAAVRRTFAEG